ncbi:alpha/beta hydrolase [Galbibacter sp. BG1]|uniref:alpha/beta hydrolase n=1 Tax=Galbibacter sp. BG1 TaxID=1170699 RepID=UPI0015C18EEF|nr:alpha/beta hydrolase [Galbibacter sp. BG1]QLE01298.1 alpha/beta hydrolase [Galbibacter sp. BG1]
MKEELIILSDIWGKSQSDWIDNYVKALKNNFTIRYYDCCELAGIDSKINQKEELHQQFLSFGIELAVQKLSEQEQNNVSILAFSIGGVIAWKFGLKTTRLKNLFCVSSTRLRLETDKPKGFIKLLYGKEDSFVPPEIWFKTMNLNPTFFENQGRDLYSEKEFSEIISKELIKFID